jgi:hypothetical protein
MTLLDNVAIGSGFDRRNTRLTCLDSSGSCILVAQLGRTFCVTNLSRRPYVIE